MLLCVCEQDRRKLVAKQLSDLVQASQKREAGLPITNAQREGLLKLDSLIEEMETLEVTKVNFMYLHFVHM
jgi:hypothetical protein